MIDQVVCLYCLLSFFEKTDRDYLTTFRHRPRQQSSVQSRSNIYRRSGSTMLSTDMPFKTLINFRQMTDKLLLQDDRQHTHTIGWEEPGNTHIFPRLFVSLPRFAHTFPALSVKFFLVFSLVLSLVLQDTFVLDKQYIYRHIYSWRQPVELHVTRIP